MAPEDHAGLAVEKKNRVSKEKRNYRGRLGKIRRTYFARHKLDVARKRKEKLWTTVVYFELPVSNVKEFERSALG